MSKGLKISLIVAGFLVLGIAAFLFFIYKSHTSDAHLAAIPKDAAAVMKINIRDLAVKADPKKLAELPALKNKSGKNEKLIAPFLEDPFSTGIDPVENLYGFVAKEGEATIASLVFNVDDDQKLSAFIRTLNLGEETDLNGVHITSIDSRHCIAWNDESGLFVSSDNDGVNEIAAAYLNQNEKKSIKESAAFETFAAKKFDIGLFIDNKKLSLLNAATGSLASLGITDGTGEVLLNFEDDKITAAYTNYPKTASIPVLKDDGFPASHFDAVSSGNPLLYLGISLDTKMLFTSAKMDPSVQQNIMGFQAMTGLSEAEINSIFTGDLSFAISDYKDISKYDPRVIETINTNLARMQLSKEEEELERESAQLFAPMAYISIDITDEARINDILESNGMQKQNGVYYFPGIDLIVYAIANKGHLLITNDYAAAQDLANAGKLNGKLPGALAAKNPFTSWLDLDQSHYPDALMHPQTEGQNEAYASAFFAAMKPFRAANLQGSINHSELSFELEKAEGNSLYQLIAFYATQN